MISAVVAALSLLTLIVAPVVRRRRRAGSSTRATAIYWAASLALIGSAGVGLFGGYAFAPHVERGDYALVSTVDEDEEPVFLSVSDGLFGTRVDFHYTDEDGWRTPVRAYSADVTLRESVMHAPSVAVDTSTFYNPLFSWHALVSEHYFVTVPAGTITSDYMP